MIFRHHDPHAHVIHVPGKRLAGAAKLAFVRKRIGGGGRRSVTASINMASFLDVMIVTVLFLLNGFSAADGCPSLGVRVPSAANVEDLIDAPMVTVTRGVILVDGVAAGSSFEVEESGRVAPLGALSHVLEQKRALWKAVQPDRPFPGVCVLQIDQQVPAVVVKSVFQTAVRSGYPQVSFMVTKLSPHSG